MSREADLQASLNYRYSYNQPEADVKAVNLLVQNGSYNFNVSGPGWIINNITLHMGGLHNIENVIAAITVAKHLGISDDAIRAAVADFKGVRRRFEYALKNESHVVIDDYAHHPEELRALISGVRSIFKDRQLTLVFQPHLFSRTNDLADGFAESLDMADEVILLPIYPARELPMPGVTSELLISKMKLADKKLMEKEEMLEWINKTAIAGGDGRGR